MVALTKTTNMEWISGNIFIRPNALLHKGHVIDGHKHKFDHTTIVFQGSIHVKKTELDGSVTEKILKAPAHLLIKADIEHQITSLEDDTTYWCVFAHRDAQGEVVQEYDGWHEY